MTPIAPIRHMCAGSPVQWIAFNGARIHRIGRTVDDNNLDETRLVRSGRGAIAVEQVWEEVLGAPEMIGDPVHVPLRPGALDIPQVPGPREFSIGILIAGDAMDDQAGHNYVWKQLVKALWSPLKAVTVTRCIRMLEPPEIPGEDYVDVEQQHECSARLVRGLGPEFERRGAAGQSMSRLSLRFVNLDGYWYSKDEDVVESTITSGEAGSIDMSGSDAATRRMVITLSGGSGLQVLTNTTNGCIMTFNGSTEGLLETDVDVFAFTAVQDGKSAIKNVNHSGDVFWMRLEPGVNILTLTGGGSAKIRARAAYL